MLERLGLGLLETQDRGNREEDRLEKGEKLERNTGFALHDHDHCSSNAQRDG